LVTVDGPLYVTVVGAGVTVKVVVELVDSSWGVVVVVPPKDPDNEYVPVGSLGETEHVATPLVLVVAVQVWVPLTVNVTGWPETGWFV
jgi:hypothetical protein